MSLYSTALILSELKEGQSAEAIDGIYRIKNIDGGIYYVDSSDIIQKSFGSHGAFIVTKSMMGHLWTIVKPKKDRFVTFEEAIDALLGGDIIASVDMGEIYKEYTPADIDFDTTIELDEITEMSWVIREG